jgi:hypothetical protein
MPIAIRVRIATGSPSFVVAIRCEVALVFKRRALLLWPLESAAESAALHGMRRMVQALSLPARRGLVSHHGSHPLLR